MEMVSLAIATIALCVAGSVAWFWGSNLILDRALPAHAPHIRPWLFAGPAVIMMTAYLVYPALATLWQSLHDARGNAFVGGANYQWLISDASVQKAAVNNLFWMVIVPTVSTALGLAVAGLTDRLHWGGFARALIFLPGAISAIAAGVIWKLVYEYRPSGDSQIGLLNALVQRFGGEPQLWLTSAPWNNLFLMLVMIWVQTGFATMILSAALRTVPQETVECAMLDGASFSAFRCRRSLARLRWSGPRLPLSC